MNKESKIIHNKTYAMQINHLWCSSPLNCFTIYIFLVIISFLSSSFMYQISFNNNFLFTRFRKYKRRISIIKAHPKGTPPNYDKLITVQQLPLFAIVWSIKHLQKTTLMCVLFDELYKFYFILFKCQLLLERVIIVWKR